MVKKRIISESLAAPHIVGYDAVAFSLIYESGATRNRNGKDAEKIGFPVADPFHILKEFAIVVQIGGALSGIP